MSDDFLSRWSRRKIEARKQEKEPDPAQPQAPVESPAPASVQAEAPQPAPAPEPLPSIDSLTHDSDFTPFMNAEVDPQLRRDALKTLFSDPRYNVMDGLDVYIDDYSKPDPLPEGWLEQMTQFARLGDYKPPVEGTPELVRESAPGELEVQPEQKLASEGSPHPKGAPESQLPAPESKSS